MKIYNAVIWETPLTKLSNERIYNEALVYYTDEKQRCDLMVFTVVSLDTFLYYEFTFVNIGAIFCAINGISDELGVNYPAWPQYGRTFILEDSNINPLLSLNLLYSSSKPGQLTCKNYVIATDDRTLEIVTDREPVIKVYTKQEFEEKKIFNK